MTAKAYPPLKALSQNFLRSQALAKNLVNKLSFEPSDSVVELGAGRGAITFLLSQRVARLLAVEIDAGHCLELTEKIKERGLTNVEVLHSDLLKADWGEWFAWAKSPFGIVGNLPYHISTPILFKIIEHRSILKKAYVMLQKEVASRLLAQPGTKEYGVITVLIGYYALVKLVIHLGPNAFFPRPKVASTFVELSFKPDLIPEIREEKLFSWTVHAAFGQRRKQIRNALTADGRFSLPLILEALEGNKIDPQCRGETLTISQFAALANTLAALSSSPKILVPDE
jgi:16S rRNA (adenine1518-N6/adenine1519-N6)-dimethyltransferase